MPATKCWIPLESNPDVLTEFAQKLGVSNIPSNFSFCDVYGLDDELLAMVPSPALAIILLFPITSETEQLRKEEEEDEDKKLAAATTTSNLPPSLFYMKQTIGNACGTIGLLHCIANTTQYLNVQEGSFMSQFLHDTREMTPEQRGKYLETPPEDGPSLDALHEASAQQGATEAPSADADVDLHFVAFVPVEGRLWELDGRKSGAVDRGETCSERLLRDAAAVIKKNFVDKANSLNFSLMALAASDASSSF